MFIIYMYTFTSMFNIRISLIVIRLKKTIINVENQSTDKIVNLET